MNYISDKYNSKYIYLNPGPYNSLYISLYFYIKSI